MGSDIEEDYDDYEYSDNGDDDDMVGDGEYPLHKDGDDLDENDSKMEWNSSENPNAAPMSFRSE
jgi:hypothetical protein